MSQNETTSADKRRQIIQGAAEVFAAEGYEGASMSRIAEKANVSKGTLYNHFDGKAELFAAWVGMQCEGILAHVFDVEDGGEDPRAVLNLLGRRIVRMLLSQPGSTIYRLVLSEAAQFPALADGFFHAGPSRAIAHLSAWLERMTTRGLMRVPDPELAAEQFFALAHTRFKLRRELGLIAEPSQAEIDSVVSASVEMFLGAYGAAARGTR
jgi:AcrR family transcriptional regulator